MPKRWRLVLNILLHVFLLFIILRTFFYHVVRQAEQEALQRQLRHSIQSTLGAALPRIDASLHGSLCEAIHRHRQTLDALDRFYSQPSPSTKVYNSWLNTSTLLVGLGLGLLFVAVYTSLRLACGYRGELIPLIFQNVVVFLVVGSLEFLFFRDVASQYVPVMPSYLYGEVVRDLQAKIPAPSTPPPPPPSPPPSPRPYPYLPEFQSPASAAVPTPPTPLPPFPRTSNGTTLFVA